MSTSFKCCLVLIKSKICRKSITAKCPTIFCGQTCTALLLLLFFSNFKVLLQREPFLTMFYTINSAHTRYQVWFYANNCIITPTLITALPLMIVQLPLVSNLINLS